MQSSTVADTHTGPVFHTQFGADISTRRFLQASFPCSACKCPQPLSPDVRFIDANSDFSDDHTSNATSTQCSNIFASPFFPQSEASLITDRRNALLEEFDSHDRLRDTSVKEVHVTIADAVIHEKHLVSECEQDSIAGETSELSRESNPPPSSLPVDPPLENPLVHNRSIILGPVADKPEPCPSSENSPRCNDPLPAVIASRVSRTYIGAFHSGIAHNIRNAFASVYKFGAGFLSNPVTIKSIKTTPSLKGGAVTDNSVSTSSNPAMFSGCTAICALLVDNTLYIANAGDSRAVLCRAGRAESLSRDHKPALPYERQRIYAAGGYVKFGRVNGMLNLSRALGDLVFKQDFMLPPERQIISGFPDVKRVELREDDEFIVMGCDGIWEYYTSQDVVDFVRARFRRQASLQHMKCIHGNMSISASSSSVDFAPRPASRPSSKSGPLSSQGVCPRQSTQILITEDDLLETDTCNQRRYGIDLAGTVEELFDLLISPNPALFEYGCDNMTAILIDLRPGSTCGCHCHATQRMLHESIFTDVEAHNVTNGTASTPSSPDEGTLNSKIQSDVNTHTSDETEE